MPEESGQERTQEATPKRRDKAREEGQVVKSREVVSTSIFLGNLLFFSLAGVYLYQQLIQLTRATLETLGEFELSLDSVYLLFLDHLNSMAMILLPLFLTLLVLAVAVNLVQTGVLFSSKAMEPKFSRINPVEGLKRIFSMQSVNELFKSLVKIGIVGYIAYTTIAADIAHVFPLIQQSIENILGFFGRSALRIGIHTSYALIAMAILDYAFQRWQHEKRLRMTLQEVKEERKESDGDPQIRSRIRSIMRELARQRMMEEVPKADVVVTNPTHVAVALRYLRQEMQAPKVVAKGAGYVAERIKAIAHEHHVPVVENRAVARNLFKTVEIGNPIPKTLYKAVAEILAYVYQLKRPVHA
jgi:flagellar biosynthetic protein FlhB